MSLTEFKASAGPAGTGDAGAPEKELSVEDWDMMFDAVQAKLRALTSERRNGHRREPEVPDTGLRLHSTILECMAALDHLHGALRRERARTRMAEAAPGLPMALMRPGIGRALDGANPRTHLDGKDDGAIFDHHTGA